MEQLHHSNNRMSLDANKKDKWGVPLIVFDAAFGENELAMRKDMMKSAVEMLETAGFKDITSFDYPTHLGKYRIVCENSSNSCLIMRILCKFAPLIETKPSTLILFTATL
jgi:hypothetical protein